MAIEGVIAERTRAILPVTWDALERDPRYGDDLLIALMEDIKEEVFGKQPNETELEAYPLIVINFVAKTVAIEIIPAAVDFWMNEPVSESATGTNESHTFDLRAQRLLDLRKELLLETRAKWGEVAAILGVTPHHSNSPRAAISTLNDEFLTPSPQEFPRPYTTTNFS